MPATKPDNLRRLDAALRELGARSLDGREPSFEADTATEKEITELETDRGELKIVLEL